MTTIKVVKKEIEADNENWLIPFLNFVDDFRRDKNLSAVRHPFELTNEKIDALLASTIEYLGNELHLEIPEWTESVPPCKEPWFVAGVENIKAIAVVESPVFFRRRKIFVLENFLVRV
ncbi:hypothetical protein QUF76_09175 [Desulfobacterales bacterium HSG16]|nr:hypothetical protein [Desulfobacterales bacterium HSG16]